MRVCLLVPGTGGTFYCQNCLRDYSLVRALRQLGHDVVMVPLYLPPFGFKEERNDAAPVFFGGINVYLEQYFPIFQKTPRWLDRIFDTSIFLKLAAAREGSTNAADLGPMTLSMLQGRSGHQRKELDRLIAWLKAHQESDLIHISNALLLGLAPEIKHALGTPIICSLQDEEPWLDAMPETFRQKCWDAIQANAASVDMFVATSRWYAERMARKLGVSGDAIRVVYPGVETDDVTPSTLDFASPTLGFLSRLSEFQGLGVLVDAFISLKSKPDFKHLNLRATGGNTSADQSFLEQIRAKLHEHGHGHSVSFLDQFDRPQRLEFFNTLSILSVPAPHGEAYGIHIVEAMASGVPVVQPAVGAYPEIIEATGGGLIYDPQKPCALVDTLEFLLRNPETARSLGRHGRAAVIEKLSMKRMAQNMISLYEEAVSGIST